MKPSAITDELCETIRRQTSDTKVLLQQNKADRMYLASEIAKTKKQLRIDEKTFTDAQVNDLNHTERLDALYKTVREHQEYLLKLRRALLSADIYRAFTKARFGVLNSYIDKFNIIFDPVAKAEKNKKEN
jgi:hypothetical protein